MLGTKPTGVVQRLGVALVAVTTGALGATAAPGCATGDTSGFGGGSSSGQTSTSTTGSGGSGAGGSSGTGGDPSACAIDCSQIQAPLCQIAQCNEQTGQCEVVADTDGSSCEDGLFCTVDDACVAGTCQPGTTNDCGVTPAACEDVTCDETSQTCTTTAKQSGAPCTDPNDLCQENSTCQNGLCTGTPKDCFFQPVPDDCHVSECNPQNGQCEPVPGNEGQICVDLNDLCTINKTCAAGLCQGGTALDCTYLTQGCVLGICDTNTGQCTTQNLNNGDPCDDINACTANETCQSGSCSNGTAVVTCEQNGDGCCPGNCTPQTDLDCNVQPSCLAIKTSSPNSASGVYVVDTDLGGPNQQMSVFCDMTTDGGGWTLVLNRVVNSDNAGQPDIDIPHGSFDNNRATNWNHNINLFWSAFTQVVFASKENNNCANCTIAGYDSAIKAIKPTGPQWSKTCTGVSSAVTTTKLIGLSAGQVGTSYMCGTTLGWGACSSNVCHYGVHYQNTASNGSWSQNHYNEMHFPSQYSSYAAYGDCCNTTDGDAWCRTCAGGLTPDFNQSSSCCSSSNFDAKSRWTIWLR